MRKIVTGIFLLLTFVPFALADENGILCEVIDDGNEKIQCTFSTTRKESDRQTTFYWHSETHPQDDRERSILLPALHGSVYDYRYLRGRAQGSWIVTVTLTDAEGTETEFSHAFTLEDGAIVQAP